MSRTTMKNFAPGKKVSIKIWKVLFFLPERQNQYLNKFINIVKLTMKNAYKEAATDFKSQQNKTVKKLQLTRMKWAHLN